MFLPPNIVEFMELVTERTPNRGIVYYSDARCPLLSATGDRQANNDARENSDEVSSLHDLPLMDRSSSSRIDAAATTIKDWFRCRRWVKDGRARSHNDA
jgi:hypothetical protein